MVKNIKGVTIELDGDVTGLTKALKKVDNETKNVQQELKQVDNLLRLDGSNVELLSQKQKLLGDAIDGTSKRLGALRQAQSEVERQFKSGEIGEEAFRKFNREIVATEGKLKALNKQADNVDFKLKAEVDTTGIDKMKTALKELGPAAKQAAGEIGSALKSGAAAGTAAVGALVVGSTDLNNDLARLRTNAEMAGNDLGLVEDAFKQITAVTGETDSAVETVSNLLASGFKDNQLEAVIEGINGAAIKFSDTLKTEGIADGIQETFATGEAIGMFAELLERSGVDLEEFNAKLAVAKKNGTEADLALQTMSDLGLTKVSDKYKEMNPELVKNNEATVDMQMALANLATVLTPLITLVTEIVTKIAEWAAENPKLATAFSVVAAAITAISGLFLAFGPIIGFLIQNWSKLKLAISAMSGPVGIAIAAITALIAVGVTLYKNWDEVSAWLKKIWETIKTNASSAFKQMGDSISKVWESVKSSTTSVWNAVKSALETAWNAIKGTAIKTFDSIKTSITNAFEAVKKAVMNTWNAIKSTLTSLWNGLKSTAASTFDGIKSAIENVWNSVKSFTTNTWNAIKSTIQNAIDSVKSVISSGMQTVKNTWQNSWDTLKSTLSNMLESMKSLLRGTNLFSIGQDIISGLVNGIKNMTGKAIEAVTGVVDGVVNKAKSLLGIKSPSRVFMEIGHDTNAGFIEGIKENNNKLQGAVRNVYGSLANSAEKSAEISTSNIKNSTSTIDNSKYMQPQINITVQGGNMTPSEIARKALQTQRQLAMEWGV